MSQRSKVTFAFKNKDDAHTFMKRINEVRQQGYSTPAENMTLSFWIRYAKAVHMSTPSKKGGERHGA